MAGQLKMSCISSYSGHFPLSDLSEGGGGENCLNNVFLVINLFYSLQSGSNGFIYRGEGRGSNFFQGVWVSKETHITCDFPGGVRTPNPPLDRHVGSPDATVCLQNHGLSKFK